MRCEVCGDRVFDPRGDTPTRGTALHANAMLYTRYGVDKHNALPVPEEQVAPEKLTRWV